MTSTNIFSGNFTEKPSSRVLRPPGGGQSNIFGPVDEPAAKPIRPIQQESQTLAAQPKDVEASVIAEKVDASLVVENGQKNIDKSEENLSPNVCGDVVKPVLNGTAAVGCPSKTNPVVVKGAGLQSYEKRDDNLSYKQKSRGTYNPITGEAYDTSAVVEEKKCISIRQPPGGASTKLW